MLSMVIPAYNEERRIGKTLDFLLKWFNSEIVVVFEGDDRTPEVVRRFPVKLIVNKVRLGKGGSIKQGILNASSRRVLLLDADLPVTKDDLVKVIREEGDLVIVRRKIVGMPRGRRFLHGAFILLTKMFFPSLRGIKDFQAGVKVLDREKGLAVMKELVMNDLLFDVNLIYSFKRRGFKVREVEIGYIHDEKNSKISKDLVKVILLMFLSLVKLRVFYSPLRGILNTEAFRRSQTFILRILR